MGNFTMTLAEVMEHETDIGLGTYPIFDEVYRETLNGKIINHFANREIGQETVSMFRFAIRRKMNEIMPRYNPIYRMQRDIAEKNHLITFQTVTSGENESVSESLSKDRQNASQVSDSDSKAAAVSNTFPNQAIDADGQYATDSNNSESTSVAKGSSESDSEGESTGKSAGTMTQTSEGFSGVTLPSLIASYAETFINTDMEVIDELEGLFMLVWDSGDTFSARQIGIGVGGWFV